MRTLPLSCLVLGCSLSFCAATLEAQVRGAPGQRGWFPFPISVVDHSPTPVDLSALNVVPAGKDGFLRVEGEQLLDGSGQPVRLFGTNFCASACFPPEEIAPKIAAHLAKNGVNVVRLHHMDNQWGPDSSIILDNERTGLHPQNLARLDRLAAELIARGIYLNINLHVSRTYPGTPAGAPSYSKGLDHFHPPFIAKFKDFAKALLTHVNPHTGRAYKDEPGVAVVEMNNENSIVLNPWWISNLQDPFAGELRVLYNAFLKRKYPDTAALQAVWGVNDGSTGPALIKNGDFTQDTKGWTVEATNGAQATAQAAGGGTVRWTSTAAGSLPWSLQFYQAGLDFDEKSSYRLSFHARSADRASISINVQNAAEPWSNIGLNEEVKLAPEWQEFQFDFTPHAVLPDGKNRAGFGLLNRITGVEIRQVRLHTVPSGFLQPDHRLEAGTVPLPGRGANKAVQRDFFAFLSALEIDHAREMKQYLREELGVKALVTHSQVLFGGIAGARREFEVSDVVDTHGYWHHPSFPRKAWDLNDWNLKNVSQVAEAGGGTLAEMAMQRPEGKPYSVSEYDVPAPNDFAAETFPLFSAMASLQDWSAIYHFAFKHSGQFESDRLTSFFDLPGHPGKQAFVPLAALAYRQHLIGRHSKEGLLRLGSDTILDVATGKSGDLWGSWRDVWARAEKTGALAWERRTGLQLGNDAAWAYAPAGEGGVPADRANQVAPTVRWKSEGPEPSLGVVGEGAIVFTGKLGGAVQQLGPIQISHIGAAGAGQVTLMAVALDQLPLAASKKIWLAALNRAENPGMGWDADRTTVGTRWGTGPAEVLGVEVKVTLPESGGVWKVEALDPTGAVQAVVADRALEFITNPDQKTVWWLLTR